MEIKLNILKKDIETSHYSDSDDCAITKALRRAGYNYRDAGVDIVDEQNKTVVDISNTSYKQLSDKVCNMYNTSIIPEDFEHTLSF